MLTVNYAVNDHPRGATVNRKHNVIWMDKTRSAVDSGHEDNVATLR